MSPSQWFSWSCISTVSSCSSSSSLELLSVLSGAGAERTPWRDVPRPFVRFLSLRRDFRFCDIGSTMRGRGSCAGARSTRALPIGAGTEPFLDAGEWSRCTSSGTLRTHARMLVPKLTAAPPPNHPAPSPYHLHSGVNPHKQRTSHDERWSNGSLESCSLCAVAVRHTPPSAADLHSPRADAAGTTGFGCLPPGLTVKTAAQDGAASRNGQARQCIDSRNA